jgi:hypothetical protein
MSKRRRHRRRPYVLQHEDISCFLSVEELATDRRIQKFVIDNAYSRGFYTRPEKMRQKRNGVITATVCIDAYLTQKVPPRLKTKTIRMKRPRPGQALVAAAEMYRKLYELDEELGGEPATTKRALAARQRRIAAARKKPGNKRRTFLVNRGFGPLIWGHDIGDLVFETMQVEWTAPSACRVTFGIGS